MRYRIHQSPHVRSPGFEAAIGALTGSVRQPLGSNGRRQRAVSPFKLGAIIRAYEKLAEAITRCPPDSGRRGDS